MSTIATLLVGVGVDTSETEKSVGKLPGIFKVGALAAGAAATAALFKSISADAANDKLAAQMGFSAERSAQIGDLAGRLYADAYGDSIEGVNGAIAGVIKSIDGMGKASTKQLEKVTTKALNFAAAFDVDVQRASQTAGLVMKSGLAKNATEAFDLITAASQKAGPTMTEPILDAADEYSTFFAQLGYNGESTFATLVQAADKGAIGVDKAGDAIKEFTIRSTDMSTASKDAYKSIGLDARTMADDILAGGKRARGATQEILDGLLSIKPGAKQANAAIALFGTPLEDLGTKDIPKFLQSLTDSSKTMDGFRGSADKMGETLNDNAATNIESFKRQITQTFVNFVGGKALPAISDLASELSTKFGPSLKDATAFVKEHKTPVLAIVGAYAAYKVAMLAYVGYTKAAAAVTAIHTAAVRISMSTFSTRVGVMALDAAAWIRSTASTVASTVATGANTAATSLSNLNLGTRIGLLAGSAAAWLASTASTVANTVATVASTVATTAAATAAKVWAAGQWLLNAALSANPIGLVVVGIAALVAGLVVAYKKSETFRNVVKKAFAVVKAAASAVASFFTSKVPAAFEKVKTAASNVFGWVKSNWPLLLGILTGPIGLAVLAIVKNWDKIKDGAVKLVNGVKNKFDDMITFIKGIPGRILAKLGDLGGLLKDAGIAVIQGLWDGLKSKWEDVKDWFGGITDLIPDIKGPPARDKKLLNRAGVSIMDGLLRGLSSREPALVKMLGKVTDRIEGLLKGKSITKDAAARMRATVDAIAREANKLQSKITVRNDLAKSVTGSVRGEFDLSALTTTEPNQYGFAAPSNFQTVSTAVSSFVTRIKGFISRIRKMRSAGIPGHLINEVAGLGSVEGSRVADMLLQGSKRDVRQLSNSYDQLDQVSGIVGNLTGNAVYGSAIDKQRRNVDRELNRARGKSARNSEPNRRSMTDDDLAALASVLDGRPIKLDGKVVVNGRQAGVIFLEGKNAAERLS